MDDEEVREVFKSLDKVIEVLRSNFVEDWNPDDFRLLVDRLAKLSRYYHELKDINPEDQG